MFTGTHYISGISKSFCYHHTVTHVVFVTAAPVSASSPGSLCVFVYVSFFQMLTFPTCPPATSLCFPWRLAYCTAGILFLLCLNHLLCGNPKCVCSGELSSNAKFVANKVTDVYFSSVNRIVLITLLYQRHEVGRTVKCVYFLYIFFVKQGLFAFLSESICVFLCARERQLFSEITFLIQQDCFISESDPLIIESFSIYCCFQREKEKQNKAMMKLLQE